VGDVQRINAVALGNGRVGRLDEKLRGFLGEQVVACLGAGAPQQAGLRIEKLGVFGGGVQRQFADCRVPGVDGGGIKARGHKP
jgi:hypothetical protein